jgi:hypothetical protein
LKINRDFTVKEQPNGVVGSKKKSMPCQGAQFGPGVCRGCVNWKKKIGMMTCELEKNFVELEFIRNKYGLLVDREKSIKEAFREVKIRRESEKKYFDEKIATLKNENELLWGELKTSQQVQSELGAKLEFFQQQNSGTDPGGRKNGNLEDIQDRTGETIDFTKFLSVPSIFLNEQKVSCKGINNLLANNSDPTHTHNDIVNSVDETNMPSEKNAGKLGPSSPPIESRLPIQEIPQKVQVEGTTGPWPVSNIFLEPAEFKPISPRSDARNLKIEENLTPKPSQDPSILAITPEAKKIAKLENTNDYKFPIVDPCD